MGHCLGLGRHPSSLSVMLRRFRRLRVTAIFYTCGGLCALLLLVNFNDDVKKLLQQQPSGGGGSSSSTRGANGIPPPPPQFPLNNNKDSGAPFNPPNNPALSLNNNINNEVGGEGEEEEDISNNNNLFPPDSNNNDDNDDDSNRPWYMTGGGKYPDHPQATKLWYEDNLNNDRILDQLMFLIDDPINNPNINSNSSSSLLVTTAEEGEGDEISPANNNNNHHRPFAMDTTLLQVSTAQSRTTQEESFPNSAISSSSISHNNETFNNNYNSGGRLTSSSKGRKGGKLKTILLYYGLGMSWGSHVTTGRGVFLDQKCPVNACRLSGNRAHLAKADVVVFKDVFMNPKVKRNPSQLWAMYMLECPLNTQNFADKNVFNLTATYRHDSDIVTPYEKWVYYDENVKRLKQDIDYAGGKTKKVAWFVSNCVAKNNRLDYARELSKHIEVDIYGACGTHACSRANSKQCFEMLARNYKFYLAFENSNCRDYISEKFFVNGLGNNVLPIVMGAHPDDYKRVSPAKSYIHVDDFATAKELAEYLHHLDQNNELYNEYFQWKGTGEFINTHFFCRLCAMAHYADKSERKPRYYKDFNKWWRGANVCTRRSWRGQPDIFAPGIYEQATASGGHDGS